MHEVVCANCEESKLEWVEEALDGSGAYLCPKWKEFEFGRNCAKPVTKSEFKAMLVELGGASASQNPMQKSKEIINRKPCLKNENDGGNKDTKTENVAALLSGNLMIKRKPLLPKILSVSEGSAVIHKPFKSPCPGASSGISNELQKKLSARRKFIPWGGNGQPFKPLISSNSPLAEVKSEDIKIETDQKCEVPTPATEKLPEGIEPLVLWNPEDDPVNATEHSQPIIVDPLLTKFLRPHQREGVQFMFECVAGLKNMCSSIDEGEACYGCILADDMGLGKTLQSITLLWTVLQQGFDRLPMAKRAIIVTPTSLVSNWDSEIKKWLSDKVAVLALCESSRADVLSGISTFLASGNRYRVLIISYETFRLHSAKFYREDACDLLICDEAHRLKNDRTLTNQALASLACRRRILLSGTPMQNDLEEFYSMVNFTNPGILGDASFFRKYYQNPVLIGREPNATDEERKLANERSNELSEKVNEFILRRTNTLLSKHLPPKIIEIVCCQLTDLQLKLYKHITRSKKVKEAIEQVKSSKVLSSITTLKKLCNHPKLVYDTIKGGGAEASGLDGCMKYFPSSMFSDRNGSWTGGNGLWVELSGKMNVLACMLNHLRKYTNDRVVLVSNYTQTLDLFVQLCRERSYPFIRLDGSTSIIKRQKLVQKFNDPQENEFAFLLSSKAGGCGLNLIGGNRLILFDPDWNPATDKQAAARIWRDGQKKRVFIYRFLSTGTIEEKVYQRQLSKEGLQKVVDREQANDARSQVNLLSSEDLRDLFTLRDSTLSDTHDYLDCKRCPVQVICDGGDHNDNFESDRNDTKKNEENSEVTHSKIINLNDDKENLGNQVEKKDDEKNVVEDVGGFAKVAGVLDKLRTWEKQIGNPLEEDLQSWGHHSDIQNLPDNALAKAAKENISFVFSCQIEGKLDFNLPPVKRGNESTSAVKSGNASKDFKPGSSTISSKPLEKSTVRKNIQLSSWHRPKFLPYSNKSSTQKQPNDSMERKTCKVNFNEKGVQKKRLGREKTGKKKMREEEEDEEEFEYVEESDDVEEEEGEEESLEDVEEVNLLDDKLKNKNSIVKNTNTRKNEAENEKDDFLTSRSMENSKIRNISDEKTLQDSLTDPASNEKGKGDFCPVELQTHAFPPPHTSNTSYTSSHDRVTEYKSEMNAQDKPHNSRYPLGLKHRIMASLRENTTSNETKTHVDDVICSPIPTTFPISNSSPLASMTPLPVISSTPCPIPPDGSSIRIRMLKNLNSGPNQISPIPSLSSLSSLRFSTSPSHTSSSCPRLTSSTSSSAKFPRSVMRISDSQSPLLSRSLPANPSPPPCSDDVGRKIDFDGMDTRNPLNNISVKEQRLNSPPRFSDDETRKRLRQENNPNELNAEINTIVLSSPSSSPPRPISPLHKASAFICSEIPKGLRNRKRKRMIPGKERNMDGGSSQEESRLLKERIVVREETGKISMAGCAKEDEQEEEEPVRMRSKIKFGSENRKSKSIVDSSSDSDMETKWNAHDGEGISHMTVCDDTSDGYDPGDCDSVSEDQEEYESGSVEECDDMF